MEEESAPDPAPEGRSRGERAGSDASTVGSGIAGPVGPTATGGSDASTDAGESADAGPSNEGSECGELRAAVVEALRTLPTQSKLVLLAVLARDRLDEGCSSTGEVYNTYEGLCADAPVDALSQRRVTDLLDELDTFGLVSATVISEGRYGRTREIEGSIAPVPARTVLLADDGLADVTCRGRVGDGEE